jgi:hypothetical protein
VLAVLGIPAPEERILVELGATAVG